MAGEMQFEVRALGAASQEGKHEREIGDAADVPTVWAKGEENKGASDLLFEGLGIAAAGAIGSYTLRLDDSGQNVLAAGVNLLVSSYNGAAISSALSQILSPATAELLRRSEAVAEIDREHNRRALALAKTDYRLYRQSNLLPDQRHLEELARKVARLERGSTQARWLQNPLPGHLTAAVGKSPACRWLVTYDDFGFAALLEKVRSVRGVLDVDLLMRSWYQQPFTGAYLEGIHSQPVPWPQVWAIIVALPETVAQLLLSPNPQISGLASCCWIVDGDSASHRSPAVSDWTKLIAKLVDQFGRTEGGVSHMSKDAVDLLVCFQDRMDLALRQAPVESVGFLTQLSRLVPKIGLNLQWAETESPAQIAKAQVQKAITRVELSLKQRQGLVQTWREIWADRAFRNLCDVVLERIIALGPISTRDLCRSCELRLERLSPVLKHLVKAEQILKQPDGRFDLPARWLSRLRVEIC